MKLRTSQLLIVIVILTLTNLYTCHNNSGLHTDLKEAKNIVNYKDTAMFYKTRQGQVVAYNKVLELDKKNAYYLIDSLKAHLNDLKIKNPESIEIIKEVLRVDSIRIPIRDTLPCDDFIRHFSIDSTYYKFGVTLTKRKLVLQDITFPNTQEIVIGTKKNGIFKREENIVAVKNSNMYMITNSVGAISFKPKTKWYDTFWFKGIVFTSGFVLGTRVR